jgi:urease accessory protein
VTPARPVRHQRSEGQVVIHVGNRGLSRFRESGAAKARFPAGASEAILINTGGGLAGGDQINVEVAVGPGARLVVTSQAAERVYRSLDLPARVNARLQVGEGSRLTWLPQETILFDGSSLHRRIETRLSGNAKLLAVEALIFGRSSSGEVVRQVSLRDHWRIWRDGRLIFAEETALAGPPPTTRATLASAGAMALVVLVAPEAEDRLADVRDRLGPHCGASAWSGKLVARCLARDGFALRKIMVPLLQHLSDGEALPKVWSM